MDKEKRNIDIQFSSRQRNSFRNSFLIARFIIPYITGLIHELQLATKELKDCQNDGTSSSVTLSKTLATSAGNQQAMNAITAARRTRDVWISYALTVPWPFACCRDGMTAELCRLMAR